MKINWMRRLAGTVGLRLAKLLTTVLVAGAICAMPAFSAEGEAGQGPAPGSAPSGPPPGQTNGGQPYGDPLVGFNDAMFTFNLKLDTYIVHPVASAYAAVVPTPARESVGHFLDNVSVIPRVANNLFQLHLERAGTEVARFGINTTLGAAGLFDVADRWFGLKEQNDDFGLTLGHYGISPGPYLVLPFLGPATIRDTVGRVADGAMNPLNYLTPFYVYLPANFGKAAIAGINFRSLHLNLFEEVDRYAIDLYGAVQDGYMQKRVADQKHIDEGGFLH